MWSLLEAARGCYDAALTYSAPFVSGKDSFNNEYLGQNGQRVSIPPTLLISGLGYIADTGKAISMDLKTAGNALFLVGDFQPVFGGSHFSLSTGRPSAQPVPALPLNAPQVYRALHQAIQSGWVCAAHDLSEGGLGVAAAEMSIGGRLGLRLDLPGEDPILSLYGETNGCLLVEVPVEYGHQFVAQFGGLPCIHVGLVTQDEFLAVTHHMHNIFSLPLHQLVEAWTR
jgi:phosphoribosylformylglycinamidine synthase